MSRHLYIHLHPGSNCTDQMELKLAATLRDEILRKGGTLWQFARRDVPADVARAHGIERVYYTHSLREVTSSASMKQSTYSPVRLWLKVQAKRVLDPARGWVKQMDWHLPVSYPPVLEQEQILKREYGTGDPIFSEITGMIIRRAVAHGFEGGSVKFLLSVSEPAEIPALTNLLVMERVHGIDFALHLRFLLPVSALDEKLRKTLALSLSLVDPDHHIRIHTRTDAEAASLGQTFGNRILLPAENRENRISEELFSSIPFIHARRAGRKPTHHSVPMGEAELVSGNAQRVAIDAFKNVHRGQRCFVAGNGPSLNKMDLNKLHGEYLFCSNAIFLLFPRVRWRPRYYTCVDTRVLPDRAPDILGMHEANPGMVCFFPREITNHQTGEVIQTSTLIPGGHNRHFFAQKPLLREWQPWIDELPFSAFSLDPGDHLVQPYTVSITLLQLAVYMGFDPIYLIGCDTDYKVPESVMQEGDETKQGKMFFTSTVDDDPNHFAPDYFGKGRKWHNPQTENMIWHYRMAHEAAAIRGTRIFNATVGGKLEVFPRVDFDGLFR